MATYKVQFKNYTAVDVPADYLYWDREFVRFEERIAENKSATVAIFATGAIVSVTRSDVIGKCQAHFEDPPAEIQSA